MDLCLHDIASKLLLIKDGEQRSIEVAAEPPLQSSEPLTRSTRSE
jgi:hypothetical protein